MLLSLVSGVLFLSQIDAAQTPTSPPLEVIIREDGEREGKALAAEIAMLYWQYEPFAETLLQAQTERRFIQDVRRHVVRDQEVNPALEAHMRHLRRTIRERVRAEGEALDLHGLLERAPGAGSLLSYYIRLGASLEISESLMAQMEPNVGPGGLHPSMFASLQNQLSDRRLQTEIPPPAESPYDFQDSQVVAFQAQYEAWIEPVRLLGRLEGRDQFTRHLIIGRIASDLDAPVRDSLIEANRALIDTVDEQNAAAAFALIDQYGFETLNSEAPTATYIVASIIQHATLEDQLRLLPLIEPVALSGDFPGQTYALMYDRVAMRQNRPQRYGTQDACVDGMYTLHPIEDEAHVDERRAEMGMQPLAEYRSSLIQMYGERC